MNIKKALITGAISATILAAAALPAFAVPPTVGVSPAAPVAQCDTAADSGAFNFHNEVYGEVGTPGGVSDSSNSSYFGLAGGSGGGQTGINNSSVCGNPQN